MSDVLVLLSLPLQSEGIFDWVNEKNAAALAATRGLSITVAVIFVVVIAIISKLAAARIIVAGIVAAIFVYIVFNVTKLEDRVDTEMTRSPISAVQPTQPPSR